MDQVSIHRRKYEKRDCNKLPSTLISNLVNIGLCLNLKSMLLLKVVELELDAAPEPGSL